ncbi:tail protein X [Psychrobacter sp. UBA6291]|uniref:tail protein X n=1 Tax=Psychrobacter sp. UBA6291 TaxID=1947357 RepID=UPI00257EC2A6|nr:tail protein X [Psychrobacter sp. UBA6291]
MSTNQYQRTIRATQNDTLDAIAYRIYAHRSMDMLPKLIESNAEYTPQALLPTGTVVILPNDNAVAAAPSIKLWD